METLRWIGLGLALVVLGLAVAVVHAKQNHANALLWAVPIIVLMLNQVAYFATYLVYGPSVMGAEFFNTWSSALRLQYLLTLLLLELFRLLNIRMERDGR